MKKLCFMVVALAAATALYAQSGDPMYIIFPSDNADLRKVNTDSAIKNNETFSKVAQLLLENPSYRILVDGHANPVVRTTREEIDSLRPLSQERAEAAADFLVSYYGVDRRRLIITGAGGRYPFESGGGSDPSLNRRVSFFVITPK